MIGVKVFEVGVMIFRSGRLRLQQGADLLAGIV